MINPQPKYVPGRQGDRILTCDPTELWAIAETLREDDTDVKREFRKRLCQIPRDSRDALQGMYELAEFEPRNDGGMGYSVVDHLWQVYVDMTNEQSGERPPGTAYVYAMKLGHSISYFHALRRALGFDN